MGALNAALLRIASAGHREHQRTEGDDQVARSADTGRPGPVDRVRALRPAAERLQFGGDDFGRAHRFITAVQQAKTPAAKTFKSLRNAQEAAVTVRLLAWLPRLHISFSSAPEGRRAATVYSAGPFGVPRAHLALSVLEVPDDVDKYLVGRSRRALRTGLNQARRAEVECVELTHTSERQQAAEELDAGRSNSMRRMPPRGSNDPHHRWFTARSPEHGVSAVMVLIVDRGTAVMRYSVAVDNPSVSSAARYALHTHVLRELSRSGVRNLVLNTPFGWSKGQHEFQRIVGYHVANVVVHSGS